MWKYVIFSFLILIVVISIKIKDFIDSVEYIFKIKNIEKLIDGFSISEKTVTINYSIKTINDSGLGLTLKNIEGDIFYKGFKVFEVEIPNLNVKRGVNESPSKTEVKASLGLIRLIKDINSGVKVDLKYNIKFKIVFITFTKKGIYNYN